MATLTADDYTVGWIAALHTELMAANAMLDERHSPLPQPSGDLNSYTFGRIGAHNVVIACLPLGRIGKAPAGIVARDMLRSFPNLRFGLMVGIGGGIPTEEMDMRLGDIAVSKPGYNDGGVVQYDYGQTVRKGRFIRSGTLNQPPTLLLTALATIQERHERGEREYVRLVQNIPQELANNFSFPGAENDRLFNSNYDHVANRPVCGRCSTIETKNRPARTDQYPRVFYGTIASADRVMRHGPTRDKIGKEIGAICFEMEAAGLMNDFSCLVIRGICDYSDTHKNYQWQPYAALTAAAYAKELLHTLPPETVDHIQPKATSFANSEKAHPAGDSGYSSETKEASISAHSTVSSLHSFFVIDPKVLNSPSVALGRLVTDVRTPWDEYCTEAPKPDESRVGISPDSLLRDLLEESSSAAFKSRFLDILSKFLKTDDTASTAKSIAGKSYFLTNPRQWLRDIYESSKVRLWSEEMIKIEWDVWLVVGIHTIPATSTTSVPNPEFGGLLPSDEEVVIAIQYRKVKFSWLDERDKITVHLEPGVCRWEPLILTKASTDTDEEPENDTLEVSLETHVDTAELVFSSDVFEEGDRILVF
jgi:nucleoside phosphorylase